MKRILIVSLIFFFPVSLLQAIMIAPSFNITVNKAVQGEDGNFNFYIRSYNGGIQRLSQDFSIQTSSGAGSYFTSTVPAVGDVYYITEDLPEGWELSGVNCISQNSAVTFTPVTNGVRIVSQLYSQVTCDFNNVQASQQKTPVLIVPGTLATDIYKGNDLLWMNIIKMVETNNDRFMDPLGHNQDGTPIDTSLTLGQVLDKPDASFDYSKALVDDFGEQGYIRNQDFFLFSYDWRKYIEENANGPLKQKIDELANSSPNGKIDVVAHSQGGLLIKRLLFDHPEYKNKIHKLIFVGTPNLGAPQSFKVLREGDQLGIKYLKVFGLDREEIKRISLNMPSVYEMLPSPEYFNHYSGYWGELDRHLFSSNEEILYNYVDTKQRLKEEGFNSLLLDHNDNFHAFGYDQFDFTDTGIDTYNIVGCQSPTYGGVIKKSFAKDKIIWVPGDQTVPLKSASNIINTQNSYALDSDHSTMLTDEGIRHKVVNIITGSNLSTLNLTDHITDCRFDGTAVAAHSPVDLHVYDSQGRHVGPTLDGGFDSEIPNVGYDTIGHEKFAFLPTGGIYTIKLTAIGAGSFSFDSTTIQDGQVVNMAYYDEILIASSSVAQLNLNLENNQSIQLDSNSDSIIDQIIAPSSVLDQNQSQDLIPPISTSTLFGPMGMPGVYREDVSMVLNAIDPVILNQENQTSGVLKTRYNLDNSGWIDYSSTTPIQITAEGSHLVKFYSTDKAGNNEPEQEISFIIDKTPPEFSSVFDITKKDLVFSGTDNLSKPEEVQASDSNNTVKFKDLAGNVTEITLKQKDRKKSLSAELLSLSYNGKLADITKNRFSFSWAYDKKGVLKVLIQHVLTSKNFSLVSAVFDGKNTRVLNLNQGTKPETKTYQGLKLINIKSNEGKLLWELK